MRRFEIGHSCHTKVGSPSRAASVTRWCVMVRTAISAGGKSSVDCTAPQSDPSLAAATTAPCDARCDGSGGLLGWIGFRCRRFLAATCPPCGTLCSWFTSDAPGRGRTGRRAVSPCWGSGSLPPADARGWDPRHGAYRSPSSTTGSVLGSSERDRVDLERALIGSWGLLAPFHLFTAAHAVVSCNFDHILRIRSSSSLMSAATRGFASETRALSSVSACMILRGADMADVEGTHVGATWPVGASTPCSISSSKIR
jgi:hypothetical protein